MDEPVSPPEVITGNIPPTGDPLISMDPTLPPTVPIPATAGESVSFSEPFVVPPGPSGGNPFAPQMASDGYPPQGGSVAVSVGKSNPWPKRLLMIAVFLLLIVGALYAWRLMSGKTSSTKTGTLTYWGLWENDSTMQSIISGFEAEHPGVKVTYAKQSPRQYRERLQNAISRGEGPDVFRFHNTWVAMLRNELSAAPSTVMTASEFSSTFYPVASADLIGGQSIYGIPVMIDGLGLFYNEDLLAAAGVTVPTTWEEVLNVVPKLTVKTETAILTSAIALGTTGNVEHFTDILATMMMQNGAKLSIPSGPQAEEAVVFYRKFATKSDPMYTWNESLDNSIFAFASGKVAMIFAPSWRVFDIKQLNPELRFRVAPIPQLPGNTVTWASYWVEGVSAKSANQDLAWELVKYVTSRESATMLYTEASKSRLFGEPYARVELGNTLIDDPYVGAFMKQAPMAKSFPLASRTFDNGINDKLSKYLVDAVNSLSEGAAPAVALETAVSGFSQVLGSYGLTTGTAPESP